MNKRKTILSTSLFIFALSCLFPFVRPVFGETVSLSIAPPLLEIMIQPGKSASYAYEIENKSAIDLYLQARIIPFEPADEYGHIQLNQQLLEQKTAPPSFFSLANSDLEFNQTFKLRAGEKKQLVLRVKIPPQGIERDHYYTLLIEQSPQGKFIGQTGGQNLIKVGSNVLLTVSQSGTPEKEGLVSQLSALPKISDLLEPVEISALVENTGKALFKPIGKIEIFHNLTKKKVKELEIRPDNILVDSQRKLFCQNTEDSKCLFSSLIPGPYQAKLSFSPDEQSTLQEKEIIFWILPIKSSLVLLVLAIIVWQVRKKIQKS